MIFSLFISFLKNHRPPTLGLLADIIQAFQLVIQYPYTKHKRRLCNRMTAIRPGTENLARPSCAASSNRVKREKMLQDTQLVTFIRSSIQINVAHYALDPQQMQFRSPQTFEDPAIMSASFAIPAIDSRYAYGPPPGLPVPPRLSPSPAVFQQMDARSNSVQGEFLKLYLKGREASVPSAVLSQCGVSSTVNKNPPRKFLPPPSVRQNPLFSTHN